jgi:hypothetical protein
MILEYKIWVRKFLKIRLLTLPITFIIICILYCQSNLTIITFKTKAVIVYGVQPLLIYIALNI